MKSVIGQGKLVSDNICKLYVKPVLYKDNNLLSEIRKLHW